MGNSSSGLVKSVNTNTSNISTLQTTVGNASSGLVKSVADNTSAISTETANRTSADTALSNRITTLENASVMSIDSTTYASEEYISVELDKNGNILSYFDKYGNKHFNGYIYSPTISEIWEELAKIHSLIGA